MIFKIAAWLFVIWIGLWLLSSFMVFLPLVVMAIGGAIALCCLYALLPERARVPAIERWLDRNWRPSVAPATPTASSSTGSSPATPTLPTDEDQRTHNKPTPPLQPAQPQLDFNRVVLGGMKVPERAELTQKLKSKVIGQDIAIESLVKVVLGKLAMQQGNKPLVVLLPGPTGTGKTELSKALATALDTKLVRFDMNNFMDDYKSSNLFGSAVGYVGSESGGALPNALRRSKRRCVLLFDEVEKAHKSLWPKFLTFFDEGYVTDTIGTVLAPKDCITLLSSNLAAEQIGKNPELAKEIIRQTGFFSLEFLGRVDKVIPLLRLSTADTARLTVVLAKRVAEDYGLSLIIEQQPLEALVSEALEAGEKEGGRGIMNQIKELLVDDFLDLQGDRVSQARLVIDKNQLRAISLSESQV